MTLKIREICENSWLNFKHTKSFNQFNVIPAKAGIHGVSLWIPDISLREIPE